MIYLSGPMTGYEEFNKPAFDRKKQELQEEGRTVVSPADDIEPTRRIREIVKLDVDKLLMCDTIYMLEGWENSKGAKAEKAMAEWLGYDVIFENDDVLDEALRITKGDRNASYGPPDQDFQRTAKMWSALKGVEFEAREVALFMVALKLSRETHQRKRDNWVDIAGYARCGSLCK